MLNASTTSANHWRYVSEGGATIVFAYTGSQNDSFTGTVLRLRKIANKSLAFGPFNTSHQPRPGVPRVPVADELEEPEDASVAFQHRCMERLIPPVHLPRLESVTLEEVWLIEFAKQHETERPMSRRKEDCVDVSRRKGVIATNLVGSIGIAVEIKPKWGFMPFPNHLSEATRPIKLQTCRFCLHSHMRGLSSQCGQSGYCPMDLFSGDEVRMTRAIHNLWDSWHQSQGTGNNLKVFVLGSKIHPNEAARMLAQQPTDQPPVSELRDMFTSTSLPLLLETPVLQRLGYLQRSLDALDIEGLLQLWQVSAECMLGGGRETEGQADRGVTKAPLTPFAVSSTPSELREPTMDEWSGFVGQYLAGHSQLDHEKPTLNHLRYYLLAYLLSATFKDCSIILRMDMLGAPQHEAISPSQVTVIDLDPKTMDRLKKWEKMDREIWQLYSNQPPRGCLDLGWKNSKYE